MKDDDEDEEEEEDEKRGGPPKKAATATATSMVFRPPQDNPRVREIVVPWSSRTFWQAIGLSAVHDSAESAEAELDAYLGTYVPPPLSSARLPPTQLRHPSLVLIFLLLYCDCYWCTNHSLNTAEAVALRGLNVTRRCVLASDGDPSFPPVYPPEIEDRDEKVLKAFLLPKSRLIEERKAARVAASAAALANDRKRKAGSSSSSTAAAAAAAAVAKEMRPSKKARTSSVDDKGPAAAGAASAQVVGRVRVRRAVDAVAEPVVAQPMYSEEEEDEEDEEDDEDDDDDGFFT
jgi:hypothetical protein